MIKLRLVHFMRTRFKERKIAMKKVYEPCYIKVIIFDTEDVVTTSDTFFPETEGVDID